MMSGLQCVSFFSLQNSNIPDAYQIPFQKLAGRGEDKSKVDSCDLNQFYDEYHAPSDYRVLTPSSFSKQEFHLWSWGYTPVFDYDKFYNHLAAVVRTSVKPSSGTFVTDCRSKSDHCDKNRMDYTKLWGMVDSSRRSEGLNKAMLEFASHYPLSMELNDLFLGFRDGTRWMTGALFVWPVTPYGFLMPVGRDEFYLSYVDLYGVTRLERRNAAGETVWYLKIDFTKGADSVIYATLNSQAPSSFNPDSATIETNLTMQEWKRLKQSDFFDLLLPLPKSDFRRDLDARIGAQIRADEQMPSWLRAIKYWWNS